MRGERHGALAFAAVVAVDVVGYSRLIGQDKPGTLAAVGALRRDIIEPAIAARAGRLVKAMGDDSCWSFRVPSRQ